MGSLDGDALILKPGSDEERKDKVRDGDTRLVGEPKELSPQIHYFAKPNSTTLSTVLILIFYHMLPFTTLPNLALAYYPYYLYKQSAYVQLTVYLGFLLLLLLAPPYYSKNVRRKIRVLYEELARYLPSAKFIIVPTEPLPEDKGYIFAIHPHGRMFYSNALFSQLHEIWRAPLKLTHGTTRDLKLFRFFCRSECFLESFSSSDYRSHRQNAVDVQ